MSLQFFLKSLTRFAVLVPGFVIDCTKRTPRSISRRASRQLFANDGLPGSAPYMSRICFGSLRRSISSGALDLHPERHLEGVDARGDLGIADRRRAASRSAA